jgi:hypothetical protein
MKFESGPSANPQENKASPETEQRFIPSPESIASLEDIQSIGIGWGGKREVFLAACEIKPATHLPIFVYDSQDQSDIEKIFVALGLQYEILMEETTDPNDGKIQGRYLDYMVSHVPENLRRAATAWRNLRQEEMCDEAEFGLAMGYPVTAVEAFQKNSKEGLHESPDSPILSRGEMTNRLTPEEDAFVAFKLSRDHWKQELDWVYQGMEITKKYAPKIYTGVLES